MTFKNFLLCPLVGAWHRPPAKTILENLPAGAKLVLTPEPDNPYDEFAIRVSVELEQLRGTELEEQLSQALELVGADTDGLFDGPAVQLGYCAASDGKPLEKIRTAWAGFGVVAAGNRQAAEKLTGEFEAKLSFGPDGAPAVKVSW